MLKSVIAEGKTTNEAIENGLKELKVLQVCDTLFVCVPRFVFC